MSLYHLYASVGSRIKKDSSKTKFDYNFRLGKYASGCQKDYIDRTGKYTEDRSEVVFTHSDNMPSWAKGDCRNFWQETDKHERKNGVLYMSIEFALPIELNDKQRADLAVKFASGVTKVNGGNLPYSLAIHRGKSHNPHCHLIMSERINDGIDRGPKPKNWFKRAANKGSDQGKGGARKNSTGCDLKKRHWWLENVRMFWAGLHNKALKYFQVEADQIDHRSYLRQQINKIPQTHLGPYLFDKVKTGDYKYNELTEIERAKIDLYFDIEQRNKDLVEFLNSEPDEPDELELEDDDDCGMRM